MASLHFSPTIYCESPLPRPERLSLGQRPRHSINYACGRFDRDNHSVRALEPSRDDAR